MFNDWLRNCRCGVVVMIFLSPLSASAQEAVSCGPWTDHPIVSGSTPLRAEHINEIRECLDLVARTLSLTPPPTTQPLPSGNIVLRDLVKYRPYYQDYRVGIWGVIINNTGEDIAFDMWTRVYGEQDQLLDLVRARNFFVAAGGRLDVVVIDTSHERTVGNARYFTVELTDTDGVPLRWPCIGCETRITWCSGDCTPSPVSGND